MVGPPADKAGSRAAAAEKGGARAAAATAAAMAAATAAVSTVAMAVAAWAPCLEDAEVARAEVATEAATVVAATAVAQAAARVAAARVAVKAAVARVAEAMAAAMAAAATAAATVAGKGQGCSSRCDGVLSSNPRFQCSWVRMLLKVLCRCRSLEGHDNNETINRFQAVGRPRFHPQCIWLHRVDCTPFYWEPSSYSSRSRWG